MPPRNARASEFPCGHDGPVPAARPASLAGGHVTARASCSYSRPITVTPGQAGRPWGPSSRGTPRSEPGPAGGAVRRACLSLSAAVGTVSARVSPGPPAGPEMDQVQPQPRAGARSWPGRPWWGRRPRLAARPLGRPPWCVRDDDGRPRPRRAAPCDRERRSLSRRPTMTHGPPHVVARCRRPGDWAQPGATAWQPRGVAVCGHLAEQAYPPTSPGSRRPGRCPFCRVRPPPLAVRQRERAEVSRRV